VDRHHFIPRREFEQQRTILSVFSGVETARGALADVIDTGRIQVLRADILRPGRPDIGAISDLLDADERDWPRYHVARGLTVLVLDVPSAHAWIATRFLVEVAHSPRTLMLAPRPGRSELEVRTNWKVPHAAA
jgi:hypothetical protein